MEGVELLRTIHWTDLHPACFMRLKIDPDLPENTREVCLSTGSGSKLTLKLRPEGGVRGYKKSLSVSGPARRAGPDDVLRMDFVRTVLEKNEGLKQKSLHQIFSSPSQDHNCQVSRPRFCPTPRWFRMNLRVSKDRQFFVTHSVGHSFLGGRTLVLHSKSTVDSISKFRFR
eukprot:sb/3472168/